MYVGIDDSGSFENEKLGLFAAVYVRPKKRSKLEKLFLDWETELPESCKKNGEVKGFLLNDQQLCEFAEHLLHNNSVYPIYHHVFATPTKGFNVTTLRAQRDTNVKQMIAEVENYHKKSKKFENMAIFYAKMAKWFKKRSNKSLLKLELLGFTIVKSINDSIMWSVVRKFDKELAELTIKIDNSFIGKTENMDFWRDMMRMMVWNMTYSVTPIIHLDSWKHSHPFLKRFYKYPKSKGRLGVFTREIRKCMNFYDSKGHFEIRIADIIANSYFRHFVLGEKLKAIDAYKPTNLNRPRNPYSLMAVFDTGKRAPNPYTDEIGDESLEQLEKQFS